MVYFGLKDTQINKQTKNQIELFIYFFTLMIDWLSDWLADWQQLHTIRLLLFVSKWKGKFLLESFLLNCFNFHSIFFYFIYIYLFLLLKVCLWIWVTQLHLFRLIWTQIWLNTIIPIQKQNMGGQADGWRFASRSDKTWQAHFKNFIVGYSA